MLAHKLVRQLSEVRRAGKLDFLRPDGKSQVSVEYVNGKPSRIDAVVISTQHADKVSTEKLRAEVRSTSSSPSFPPNMVDAGTKYHINPTGRFVVGGPHGDTGLTGRKIIVDTYGGMGRHGGGAFSGKDPTKVDRSACYMARYIAKNIVAAGLATRCEVQLAYAIGVAEPVSVLVDTFGTGVIEESRITELVRANFQLTPKGIIESLEPAPADLSQDGGVRPLRPDRRKLYLGSHRQGRPNCARERRWPKRSPANTEEYHGNGNTNASRLRRQRYRAGRSGQAAHRMGVPVHAGAADHSQAIHQEPAAGRHPRSPPACTSPRKPPT